ncbi:MAG TPA: WYL domain-containing protein, partial [Candidatus Polarisedimenticolia bacterium]|nr:WYL domain-containing protein [Candidatus Polarisedimenticolia bacterium]
GPRAGPAGNIVLDTCALARTVLPGSPSYRLRTLAARLGIPEARPHRAMSDVATCKELFLRILHTCGPGIDLDGLIRLNRTELYLGPPREEVFQRLCAGAGPRLSSLRDAVLTGVPIAIRYRGGTKGDAPRLVTPITVMVQANHAYLVAQCHLDQGLKNFRLDLISAVQSAPA